MRSVKSLFGVFGALLPVLYCGGLLYYFNGVGGSPEEAVSLGLGPTMLGLGLVGLLFCIPLILKLARVFTRPRSPRPEAPMPSDKGGFDADAVIARYLERNPAAPDSPATPRRHDGGAAKPSGFGRRTA